MAYSDILSYSLKSWQCAPSLPKSTVFQMHYLSARKFMVYYVCGSRMGKTRHCCRGVSTLWGMELGDTDCFPLCVSNAFLIIFLGCTHEAEYTILVFLSLV